MVWWYTQNNVAHYHLAAYSDLGYATASAFALFAVATEYFTEQGFRWLGLNAGAGLQPKTDGLTRFKSGWATGTRPVYLGCCVFQPEEYERLVRANPTSAGTNYFPRYRAAAATNNA